MIKLLVIQNIISQLQSVAMHYLILCFFIINDLIYWWRFLSETEHYTLWLDYSQNINFTEKRQVQSAHFSGRQHPLHNTVLQATKNGKHTYTYHLSDDTNHDSVMTFSIIKDITHCHPEVIQDKVLILCSNNCQVQYKCKYMFFQMKKLAIDLKKKVVWFYGELGHGWGLVDAMSSFGCKLQLKNKIVTFDSWFESAEKRVSFLKKYFVNDDIKEHYLIDDAETAQVRKQKNGEFNLEPCRKYHWNAVDSVMALFQSHCFLEMSE